MNATTPIDIQGYEGLYAIHPDGNVWCYPKTHFNGLGIVHKKGKFLKPGISGGNYLTVSLSKDGVARTHTIHRLLASYFIDNPDNLKYVNHIDGNKLNNSLNNLEWVTPLENSHHAFRTGLMSNRITARHDSRCTCYRCLPKSARGAK